MSNRVNRPRYVGPQLREAKALADQCGEEYIKAWSRPHILMAEKTMLEIFLKSLPIDCGDDLIALTAAIEAAKAEVPVAKQVFMEARALFHSLKAKN